ncbi:NADH:ubiquinone reductase (Na(+)-transporting) subunit C [Muribaculum sp. An289]|uniref:NADH:ubiquinone reductase (Na(+)-transporting) subunit C n=1 Tax=unclassified Muribaculum TaxID=2622126 RepID=UPI000B374859|nr:MULTISPECIES: NADH:ubiquinone reductase (Na(+)-transporting) subunit C [unclassified Muribaculum]OUO37479.1 NADH:ubiquinone reductase (Na(+)-transporting) subunit C [Muribaculum sp. An289]OUO43398.1 NADH:ubiquinone reductase (Na(+)-transporting) subunit C [Muribaculum sp. An287]
MNTNGNTYTVIYSAVLVILVAAILAYVSLALQPRQNDNIRVETMSKILTAAGLYNAEEAEAAADINKFTIALYNDNLQAAIYVNGNGEKTGDMKEVAGTSELKAQYDIMKKIGDGTDESLKAGLRLPVYIFNVNGQTIRVVPCYGAGLWGPIWGYLAFTEDMNTLDGAVFDHKGETPGLGAEIALPKFYDQFGGKQILDENGNFVSVSVVKGGAKGDIHGVDAISGGTITSKALETTMRTWLSFYRPYFTNVINGEE